MPNTDEDNSKILRSNAENGRDSEFEDVKVDTGPRLQWSQKLCLTNIKPIIELNIMSSYKPAHIPEGRALDTRLSVEYKRLPQKSKSAMRMSLMSKRQSELGLVRDESYIGWETEAPLSTLVTFWCAGDSRKPNAHSPEIGHGEDENEDKEQKWFGVFTDLIFVTVILQFSIQLYTHVKGFYLEPTKLSYIEFNQIFQPAKTYSHPHNSICAQSNSTEEILIGSDGMECWYIGDDLIRVFCEATLYFFSIYVVWLELSCSLGRFTNITGMLDDILYLGCVVSILFMSCYIEPWKHTMDNGGQLGLGVDSFYISFLFLHILYYHRIEKSRNYAHRRIWTYSTAVVINTLFGYFSRYLDNDVNSYGGIGHFLNFMGIMLSSLIVFYVSLTGFIVQNKNNIIVEHFVERFGVLIMITMGESILSLIIADEYEQDWHHNFVMLISFLLMYILKDLYFLTDVAPMFHALRMDGSANSCLWVVLHFPLCLCLLLLGVGFKLIFKTDLDEVADYDYGEWLIWPLFTSMIIIDIIHMTHGNYPYSIHLIICKISLYLPIPCILLITDGYEKYNNAWLVFLLSWCVAWTFVKLNVDSHFVKIQKKKKTREVMESKTRINTETPVQVSKWKGWKSTGFMGPKVELWPPSLLADLWNRDYNKAFSRITQMSGDEDLHPNEHIREEENTRDWLMEFGDLIFVGVIFKFADNMKYTWNDNFSRFWVMFESTLFFFAFFSLWLELVSEFVRFQNMPGVWDDVFRCIFLYGICLMAIQIRKDQYLMSCINGFNSSFLISVFAIFLLHMSYIWNGCKDAIVYCRIRVMVYGIIMLSTFVSICVQLYIPNYWLPFVTLGMNVLFLLSYSLNSFRVTETKGKRKEKHEHYVREAAKKHGHLDEIIEGHFVERFGLIVMITAGESILALVLASTLPDFEWEANTFMLLFTAFLMVYVIKMQYFLHNVNLEEGHALLNNKFPGSVAFCTIHVFISLAMLWVGVGWKLLFYNYNGKYVREPVKVFMCVATVGVCLFLIICRFTHEKYVVHKLSVFRLIPMVIFTFFAIEVQNPLAFTIGTVVFLATVFLMDVQFYNKGAELENLAKDHNDRSCSE